MKVAKQPALPKGIKWPAQTRAWWRMWRDSPMAVMFTATDWDFLLDTALLHAKVWGERDMKSLPELRLRVAKFGATPEDRLRLRIELVPEESKSETRRQSAQQRYGGLTVVPGGADAASGA